MDEPLENSKSKLLEFRYRKELLSHPFFKKLDYWAEFQIANLKIENRLKRNMVTLFLKIFISEFYDSLQKFLDAGSNIVVNDFPKVISDTNKRIHDIALEKEIPEIFLKAFEKTQENHLHSIDRSINYILTSKLYESDIDKINAILDVLLYYFVFVTLSIENTSTNMNGKLEKLLTGGKFDI